MSRFERIRRTLGGRTHDGPRRAFTLVELLVVIGIIGLLVAILLPTLARGRAAAQQVACASNLRQLGIGLHLYVDQHRYYPGSCALRDEVIYAAWPTRLRGALGLAVDVRSLGLFHCPARDSDLQWDPAFSTGPHFALPADAGFGYLPGERLLLITARFSYGYNDWGSSPLQGPPYGTTHQKGLGGDLDKRFAGMKEMARGRVRRAAEMIALADSNADGTWDYSIDPNNPAEQPGAPHNGGTNVLFVDGHVERRDHAELIAPNTPEKAHLNRLWNNDHSVVLPSAQR
ncbi:MAG TPA: DUF1559 domain-containing protein [Tepidisphaeraceae bacterium]|nr:DUF1559 domain-containing protein [Tepidisphaeraceae bacterium]